MPPIAPTDRSILNQIAELLTAHGDFKVLRRVPEPVRNAVPDPNFPYLAAIVDCETTGLDPLTDIPFDVGIVLFSYNDQFRVGAIVDTYQGLQDPGVPLSETIVALTGYHDEDLKGHTFDMPRIEQMLLRAGVVLAHSAKYDRKVFERLTPVASQRKWACSATQVPWQLSGFASAKLEYLAYRFGTFFEGHTALADCLATYSLFDQVLPYTAKTVLASMIGAVLNPDIRIWCVNSPYSAKDALKSRGYRWNPGPSFHKAWWTDVSPTAIDTELAWLSTNAYGGQNAAQLARIEALRAEDRFSVRSL